MNSLAAIADLAHSGLAHDLGQTLKGQQGIGVCHQGIGIKLCSRLSVGRSNVIS
jgi:hypothetical protein